MVFPTLNSETLSQTQSDPRVSGLSYTLAEALVDARLAVKDAPSCWFAIKELNISKSYNKIPIYPIFFTLDNPL